MLLAPLLPGLVQHWKARLQGRRGPTPLQPYRELRRLWGKSTVTVEGTTPVYRLAPAVVAASVAAAVLLVPAAELAPDWGVGHDALALAGLLALARFALAAAAWDVANGFSLMGASRDLTISVFVEATLVLSLAVAALVAGTTDLRGIVAGTAGTDVWSSPALALGGCRVRPRRRRRDGTAARRQPGHAPRADDDPRGAAARVRGPRPRLPAVGRRRAPLARARARRADLPPPRAGRLVAARAAARRARRPLRGARAHRDARREDAHPARSAPAVGGRGSSRCSASSPGWWRRRERHPRVGARRVGLARGRRPAPLGRGRPW